MATETRVFIVDDQALWRKELGRRLSESAKFEVTGDAAGPEALEKMRPSATDLVLLGLHAGDTQGLLLLRRIKALHPAIRAVALSDSEAEQDLLDALGAGANGYLLKSTKMEELQDRLGKIMSGLTVVQDDLKKTLVDSILRQRHQQQPAEVALTKREHEILACLTRRLDKRAIARKLGISVSTVKTHIQHVLVKLDGRHMSRSPQGYGAFSS